MKTRYRIGLVYSDGYKCWADHHPLNTLARAKATARMAWISGMVAQSVIFDNQTNQVIERYEGE